MESKKINRTLLLQGLLFIFFIAIVMVFEEVIAPRGEPGPCQSGNFFDVLFFLAVFVGTMGSGLTAGLYLTFSDFVMKSLLRLPADQSATAFNAVNETVQPLSGRGTSLLIPILVLTAFICAFILIVSVVYWHEAGSLFLIFGSAAYLLSFIITIAYHIPRNNRLLSIFKEPDIQQAVRWWNEEAPGWTFWNTVRGCAALSASVLLILALLSGGTGCF